MIGRDKGGLLWEILCFLAMFHPNPPLVTSKTPPFDPPVPPVH
jgi:hypothetical protein